MKNFVFCLLILAFSPLNLANQTSLLEHVNGIFTSMPELGKQRTCLSKLPEASLCSSAISDYMEDREDDTIFTFMANGNPRELCTGVQQNDYVFTTPDKLDDHFQKYTGSFVPGFNKFNKGCLSKWSTLSDQRDLISFYYYGQTRILADGLSTLNSMAAINAKLGEPVLDDVKCDRTNSLSPYCKKLKTCPTESGLAVDVTQTKMALSIISELDKEKDEEKKNQIEQGLYRLYPWIEGKAFKANFDESKLGDDAHIEKAIRAQHVATKNKLKERLSGHKKLSSCLEGKSNGCENFKDELATLVKAPILGGKDSHASLIAGSYQHQQSCMQAQYETKKTGDSLVSDLVVGSGVTIATMGLGSIVVGSGVVFKGTAIGAASVRNVNLAKNAARAALITLNASMIGLGIKDAAKTCQSELSKLEIYAKLKGQVEPSRICPEIGSDPHYQLMADYKACLISAAFVGLDFLPIKGRAIVDKFRRKPVKPTHEMTLARHPDLNGPRKKGELEGKELEDHYVGEHEGKGGFAKQTQEWTDVKTVYLDGKEREMHRMFIVDGKVLDTKGRPITITEVDEVTNGIYVMDKKGNFYWRNNSDVGEFHHSSFLAGEEVAGAGIFKAEKGVLSFFSNGSGHYKPTDRHLWQTIHKLMDADVDMDKVYINVERKTP